MSAFARFTTAALGAALILTPAAARAATSTDPANSACTVTAEENTPGQLVHGVNIAAGAGCDDSPVVSVTVWDAPSLTGDPIDVQQRELVAYDDHLNPGDSHGIYWAPDIGLGCYVQVDVAWGHAPTDLTTPYGSRLIVAWHAGDHSCLNDTPTPTTAPPSSPPATPTPSVPANAAPSLTPTTPPATTAPPTTTSRSSPTPTKRPAHHHKTTPQPTRPQPTPSASGCIASGCHTTPPAPRPHATTTPAAQLPYTGTPSWLPWALVVALAAIAGGAALLMLSAAGRLRDDR